MNKQALRPPGIVNKPAAQVDAGPQLQPAEERRRSQRVIIQVPVTLELVAGGSKVKVKAKTASVNDQGAMLISPKNFPVDTELELVNERTSQKQSCRVTRTAAENQHGYLIPVAFSASAPGFWQICFPPPGWKPLEN